MAEVRARRPVGAARRRPTPATRRGAGGPPSRTRRPPDSTRLDPWGQLARAWDHIAAEETRKEKAQLGYQVWGGIVGFGQGAEDTVLGLREMVTHPVDTASAAWSLGVALTVHPIATRVALWHQFADPYRQDWADDERGHAVGTGVWQALELFVGFKGLTKTGHLADDLRDAAAANRAAKIADLRIARERHGHLTSNAIQVGLTRYLFRDEREACWALHHPLPSKTYRVEYETLPTDYHLDALGRIEVIRGPKTLDRTDIPVVPDNAYQVRNMLQENGWEKLSEYRGGRHFQNLPGRDKDTARLPQFDGDGHVIVYTEFDINPRVRRRGRGVQRIVRGANRVWYTDDHYKTFVEVR